jgi:hypothetical protein
MVRRAWFHRRARSPGHRGRLPGQPGRKPCPDEDPPRLSALGKMHRFNDLPWNPAHRDIQGPLQGTLRTHGRPVQKAAALTLPMPRQILATCDRAPAAGATERCCFSASSARCARSELLRCTSRTSQSSRRRPLTSQARSAFCFKDGFTDRDRLLAASHRTAFGATARYGMLGGVAPESSYYCAS